MEIEPGEEWEGASLGTHMLAGSIAGVAEHVSIYPIDTLKTRLQASRSPMRLTFTDQVKRFRETIPQMQLKPDMMMKGSGNLGLYRGVQSMFIGCIPAHASYFGVWELSMNLFGVREAEKRMKETGESAHLRHAVAGGVSAGFAVVAHDAVLTPWDLCKQRMQMGYYSSLTHALKEIYAKEGFKGFYVGYKTALIMNIPYQMVLVASNEWFKLIFKNHENTISEDIPTLLSSAAVAAAIAGFLTNPLDLAKTRLQTQKVMSSPPPSNSPPTSTNHSSNPSTTKTFNSVKSSINPIRVKPTPISPLSPVGCIAGTASHSTLHLNHSHFTTANPSISSQSSLKSFHGQTVSTNEYKGLVDVLVRIFKEEGFKGYFRGAIPRMMINAPSAAISWTTYEILKHVLLDLD